MSAQSRRRLTSVLLTLSASAAGCQRSQTDRGAAAGHTSPASPAAQPAAAEESAAQQDCVRGTPVPILVTGESGVRPTFEKVGSDEAREREHLKDAVSSLGSRCGKPDRLGA